MNLNLQKHLIATLRRVVEVGGIEYEYFDMNPDPWIMSILPLINTKTI